MSAPKVTVFIPVYNREKYIATAIDSILAQTFQDFELLLVDDGSTDASVQIIAAYRDPRLRLVRQETNQGIPKTRNKGLELARGEYIALLDSDDYAYPQRLARQVAFLDAHPEYVEIGTWNRAMNARGVPMRKLKIQPVLPQDVKAMLLFRCCIKNRSVLARTAVLREYGYREEFPRCQDYDLHVRLAAEHPIANLPQVLVLGRLHDERYTGQTTDLGKVLKMRIMAAQLSRLGVRHSERDLERHYHLAHRDAADASARPDARALDWAEAWLRQLLEANRKAGVYDEQALARVTGEVWLRLCHRASRRLGWRGWQRFLGSPLRRGAWAALQGHARYLVSRRFPAHV